MEQGQLQIPEPRIRKAHSGYLALSPDGARVRIGVAGETEDQARLRFKEEFKSWEEIHARGQGK